MRRHTGQRQRGIAAIEMALVVLPLLILCFGITEIGRALYLYNGLVKAARGAVRHVSQPVASKTAQALRDEAIFLALCGKTACAEGDAPLVPGLTVAHISVCDPSVCASHDEVPVPNLGGVTVDMVTVFIGIPAAAGAYTYQGATLAPYVFTSVVPWVIPDISFGAVSATMVVRTL